MESPTHTPPTAYIWCQRGGMMLMDKNSRRVLVLEENNRHSSLDFRTTDFRTTDSEITDSKTTDSQTIWFTKIEKKKKNIFCFLPKMFFKRSKTYKKVFENKTFGVLPRHVLDIT